MSLNYVRTTPEYFKIIKEIYIEKLNEGYDVTLLISSTSMSPTIPAGSLVSVRADKKYRPGDIVVISDRDGFYVHRIIKINNEFVVTKGDNNISADTACTTDKIIGRIIGINGLAAKIQNRYYIVLIKIRQIFLYAFVKLKNLIFKFNDNLFLKYFLLILYKLQILYLKIIFKKEKDFNIYLRGSAVSGSLRPGISDIDFVVIKKNDLLETKVIRKISNIMKFSLVINFNSILPRSIYSVLLENEFVEDYEKVAHKVSGEINIKQARKKTSLTQTRKLLQDIQDIDDIMFKFSQIGTYHSSYLNHNLKKILLKLIKRKSLENELSDFILYLNKKESEKNLKKDIMIYAKALAKIIKSIDVPKNNFPSYDFKHLNYISISEKKFFIFKEIRRYESYILENNFDENDLFSLIDYTITNNTYPFFIGIMTKKTANFLQFYNLNKIIFHEFDYSSEFLKDMLFTDIKIFNNLQLVKNKDRFATLKTACEIVKLCRHLIIQKNPNYVVPAMLLHFIAEEDKDLELNAYEIYIKYVEPLNHLFLEATKIN